MGTGHGSYSCRHGLSRFRTIGAKASLKCPRKTDAASRESGGYVFTRRRRPIRPIPIRPMIKNEIVVGSGTVAGPTSSTRFAE